MKGEGGPRPTRTREAPSIQERPHPYKRGPIRTREASSVQERPHPYKRGSILTREAPSVKDRPLPYKRGLTCTREVPSLRERPQGRSFLRLLRRKRCLCSLTCKGKGPAPLFYEGRGRAPPLPLSFQKSRGLPFSYKREARARAFLCLLKGGSLVFGVSNVKARGPCHCSSKGNEEPGPPPWFVF